MDQLDSEYDFLIRGLIATTRETEPLTRDIDNFQRWSPSRQRSQGSTSPTDSRMVKLPDRDELTKLFECPVCYDTIVPPINGCRNGHIICFNCRRNVNRCPVCRAAFSELRNIFAEHISAKCIIICKHHEAGCTKRFHGDELMGHEYFCDFRPIRCPDCEKHIEFHKFIQHLEAENVSMHIGHECNTGYEITGDEVTGGRQAWEPTWIRAYDTNFFGSLESDSTTWWFSVACFGTVAEAAQFRCEIILWNKDKGMELRYCGPVYSLRTGSREAIYRGECLPADKMVIDAYSRHGGVDVIIKIFRRTIHLPRFANEERDNHQETVSLVPLYPIVESVTSSPEGAQSPGIANSEILVIIPEEEPEIAEVQGALAIVNIDGGVRIRHGLRAGLNKNAVRRISRPPEQGSPVSHESGSNTVEISTESTGQPESEQSETRSTELRRRRSSLPIEDPNARDISPDSARRRQRYSVDSLELFM